ncbi:MAG: trigger factor [Candidatus Rokubacteria bacterium]|nr:trigger factor [Candidatus Rokubacteria bacterium]
MAEPATLEHIGPRAVGGLPAAWPNPPRSNYIGEMKVAVEELEACKRRLQVEAPEDLVRQAWEEAYGRVQRQARLPGFRKGHVPRTLVKLHFADEVRREVANRLIPEVYRRALAEAGLLPVEEPELQDVTLEEGIPLKFTAVVEIKPAITLGTYRGLRVQQAPTPVTDAEVEQALGHLREHHAEFRSVERAATHGDLVIVDYTLLPDAMEPRSERGYAFLVGSQSVLPEIDAAVTGLPPGEEREVPVRFPEDHPREELRGRAGTARVKAVEVKEKVLAALDDEFARGLGEYEDLAALRAAVRKELEAQRERENRRALEEGVVEVLLAGHAFQVPEAMVLRQMGHAIGHTRERIRRQGVDPDKIPWDYEKLASELRPGAEKAVRRALLLEAIAEREGLNPSDDDVTREVERVAAATKRPAPAVRRLMEQSGDLDSLRLALREARVLDFLIEHATIDVS